MNNSNFDDYLMVLSKLYRKRMENIIQEAIRSNVFDGIPLDTTVLNPEYPASFDVLVDENFSQVLNDFDMTYVRLDGKNHQGYFFLRDQELVYIYVRPMHMQIHNYTTMKNLLLASFCRIDLLKEEHKVDIVHILTMYLG